MKLVNLIGMNVRIKIGNEIKEIPFENGTPVPEIMYNEKKTPLANGVFFIEPDMKSDSN